MIRMRHICCTTEETNEKLWSALWRHVWLTFSYQLEITFNFHSAYKPHQWQQLPFFFAKMVRYERLDGDEEEGRSGGGANISLKRNLLVVLLALVLFATILGNILLHFSTQLCIWNIQRLFACKKVLFLYFCLLAPTRALFIATLFLNQFLLKNRRKS